MAKKRETVDEYMAALDHPFKAEVEALRAIIKGVNPNITEQVKWNAPSYRYKGTTLPPLTYALNSMSISSFIILPLSLW